MAQISWGKPVILVAELGEDVTFKWIEAPTPAQDTTTMETTQGNKTEAKIEGGANEDVKTEANTYALNYNIRKVKGRKKHIVDSDGSVSNNYALVLQPEDKTCTGILIQLSSVSVGDSYSAAEGIMYAYTHNVLAPTSGNQVKYGLVNIVRTAEGAIQKVTFTPDEDDKQGFDGKTTYDITSTEKLLEANKESKS